MEIREWDDYVATIRPKVFGSEVIISRDMMDDDRSGFLASRPPTRLSRWAKVQAFFWRMGQRVLYGTKNRRMD